MADAKKRWTQLDGLRSGPLRRAREAAKLTLPSVLPDEGDDENSDLVQPYQSLGARGVNNLASKLLMALLPTSNSFFRFSIDLDVLEEMKEQIGEGADEAIDDIMRRRENKIMKWIERSPLRTTLFIALKQLIITGNALVHIPKNGKSRTFRLDQFVVVRDPSGDLVELYIREEADPMTLSKEVRETCQVNTQDMEGRMKNCEIFTTVRLREGGKMLDYWQEINEIEVPNTRGQSKVENSPYICMRWTSLDNESYGRGHVEEYIGDLRSLEGLSQAIVGFSAVASKVIFLVHPNSTTDVDDLTIANTGDFVTGALKDIEALQLDKYADFQVAQSVVQDLVLRLSHAFLLTSGTVRDAERVTREEIRMQAQELEDVLGGVYTLQSQELQLPLVRRVVSVMESSGDIDKLPTAGVEPTIVTGFDALGRGHELNRIRGLFADIAQTLGPEVLARYLKIGDALKKFAVGHNVDIEDLFKDDATVQKEIQAEQRQQAMMQAAMNAAGPAAGQAVKGAADAMNKDPE